MAQSRKRRDDERRSTAAKVAEMRRAQEAVERRRRSLIISAAVVAVVVVVLVVFVAVQSKKSSPPVASGAVGGSTGSYGFVVGKADAPASMVVYEDFQCPVCKNFEDTDGAMLSGLLADGTLKIEYRPIAFLNRMSATSYSTRSLNASACVSDHSTIAAWKKFHDLLFANQPPEGGDGLPDAQLTSYAKQAGADAPAVGTCIANQTFKDWTASATDAASKDGVSGTPTVRLNGTNIEVGQLADPNQLKQLIESAANAG